MKTKQIICSGIAASAIAHLSALAFVILFSEVHSFGVVTAEPIAVDLVPAVEAVHGAKLDPPVLQQNLSLADVTQLSSKSAAAGTPASSEVGPGKQTGILKPDAEPRHTNLEPRVTSRSASPAYTPPEPDLSIKYNVLLGLPLTFPVPNHAGDYFDAAASENADVNFTLISEFRRHLKTCSKLPASIEPSDKITITLRVFMTPDARLAMDPILIEASASAKGPELMQSAITALADCQPYSMLPAGSYGEWKVLDLSFTPRDLVP